MLLIDEIDKADIEFPNDLLRELDRMEFFVYETRETVHAKHRPVIVITSNNEKELPDAFLRRCFFHYIRFPDEATMTRIVDVHFPDLKRELLREALTTFFRIRETPGLKKKPTTSELLDWIKLLVAEDIAPEALRSDDAKKLIPPLYGALLEERTGRALCSSSSCSSTAGMLVRFFLLLRNAGVPVSITELMTLLEALQRGLGESSAERFYYLARTCLVKDERHYDRFDRAFAAHFKGAEDASGRAVKRELPADWLERLMVGISPTPRKPRIEALGGWDELMETLKKRLEEQNERHQGGNKWIGTAGTSPFGAYGYNPEGVRIGQEGSRNRSAVKVWDTREFANLDDTVELGTRNMKLALRRLRRFARRGAPDRAGARRHHRCDRALGRLARHQDGAGAAQRGEGAAAARCRRLDGRSREDLRGAVFGRAQRVQASRALLFPQFPYEALWRDNRRRSNEHIGTVELMRTYASDYKLIFVGDATMSPYEVTPRAAASSTGMPSRGAYGFSA